MEMATAIRTIGHEERLSIVDHLDELRTRLIVSAIALALVFGVCLWQNHVLLEFINRPLNKQTRQQVARGEGRSARLGSPRRRSTKSPATPSRCARALGAPASGLPARDAGAAGGSDLTAAGRCRQDPR